MNEEKLKELKEWFEKEKKSYIYIKDEGGMVKKTFELNDIYPCLKIEKIEGMGYGLIYEGEDKKFSYGDKETCVIMVPYHMFLSFKNIASRDLAKESGFLFWLNYSGNEVDEIFSNSCKALGRSQLKNLENHEIEEVFLTLFLALYRKKRFDNYWKPYTEFLSELPEQGSYEHFKQEYAETILPLIRGWWDYSEKEITESLPKPEPSELEHQNNKIYRWAYSIIKTRASKPTKDNNPTNTYLIPIFDFFNTNPSEKKLFSIYYHLNEQKSEHDCVFISVMPGKSIEIKNGEQIFINYGGNLMHYGIMEKGLSKQKEDQIQQIIIEPK
jgi:hypothetical protein